MKREIITAKVPKLKRRADFLFHDGQFKPKTERTNGFSGGKEVVSGQSIAKVFSIPALTMQVIELTK